MKLSERISQDIAAAMKARDAARLSPLRMVKAAFMNAEVSKGLALEEQDIEAALDAYRQALEADPELLDAQLNRGRLLHEAGRLGEAEEAYTDAITACGAEPLLLFNLGVLLEDMDRTPEAIQSYCAALDSDPSLADGHYNLALLYETLKQPKEAIRHMAQYRRLTATKSN